MLGNGRLEALCFDGVKRLCHIRGKLRKKVSSNWYFWTFLQRKNCLSFQFSFAFSILLCITNRSGLGLVISFWLVCVTIRIRKRTLYRNIIQMKHVTWKHMVNYRKQHELTRLTLPKAKRKPTSNSLITVGMTMISPTMMIRDLGIGIVQFRSCD